MAGTFAPSASLRGLAWALTGLRSSWPARYWPFCFLEADKTSLPQAFSCSRSIMSLTSVWNSQKGEFASKHWLTLQTYYDELPFSGPYAQGHHRSPGFADDAIVIAAAFPREPGFPGKQVSNNNPDYPAANQANECQQNRIVELHALSLKRPVCSCKENAKPKA